MSLVTAMTVVALLGMVATAAEPRPRPRPPIADVARNENGYPEGDAYCQDGDLLVTVFDGRRIRADRLLVPLLAEWSPSRRLWEVDLRAGKPSVIDEVQARGGWRYPRVVRVDADAVGLRFVRVFVRFDRETGAVLAYEDAQVD